MILITGSEGFIGSRIADSLGEQAICLQRLNLIPDRLVCDLTDIKNVKNVARQLKNHNITHIIHAAGITPWSNNTDFSLDIDIAKSVELLCHQLKIRQLLFISGWNVYDMSGPAPFSEQTPLEPLGEYGASKLRVERFFKEKLQGVQALNLRLASVYGPGQTSPGLITNLVQTALSDHMIVINAAYTKRDYLYIDDLVQSITRLIGMDVINLPHSLNLGSGRSVSILEIAQSIKRICKNAHNFDVSIEYAQKLQESHPLDNQLVIDEANRRGLLTKTIPFEEGLSNYIEWRINENIL